MNEYALLHLPDSNYCFPEGNSRLTLRLRTGKQDGLDRVTVLYSCKYDFHSHRQEKAMEKKYSDRLFDYYETTLELEDVRTAYVFELCWGEQRRFYCEDGLVEHYDFDRGFYNFFQLPYINEADVVKPVSWMDEAVFYQIFVDRFYAGKWEKDRAYINLKWGEKPNPRSFAGGDLQGIIEKLDYISVLGVNTVYLTPIFASVSNHKYDISDYRRIDPQFGTNELFGKLVEELHGRGMRIVLDAVFNHCSSSIMQFQDVLEKGRASVYYDWFLIDGDRPDMDKRNYECFGACEYMPKLNTSNEEVRKFLLDIACYWVERYDIDGWRLDVSDEISHGFWREFRREIKKRKADCVIIGENWHDAYPFLMGDQYDGIMNYAFTKACLDYFAFGAFDAQGFADKLNQILMRNKAPINRMMMNLLDSHDTHRFFTEAGKDKDKLLAAVAVLVCFMGAPCIYYGTEICMEGGYDPDCRRTFDWEEKHWDKRAMEIMKKLLALKKEKALREGQISVTAPNGIFCLLRTAGAEQVCLLHSSLAEPCPEHIWRASAGLPTAEADMRPLESRILASNRYDGGNLEPGGFLIIRL